MILPLTLRDKLYAANFTLLFCLVQPGDGIHPIDISMRPIDR